MGTPAMWAGTPNASTMCWEVERMTIAWAEQGLGRLAGRRPRPGPPAHRWAGARAVLPAL